jgi:lathosterol oxidase
VLFTKLFFFQTIRYFIISGGAFLILNKWGNAHFKKYRIQETPISQKQISTEIKYSLVTLFIFSAFFSIIFNPSLSLYIKMYSGSSLYPVWWNLLSIPTLIIIHDTYFYWMHRTIHHQIFYNKFHRTHHQSTNPTPFAAFSFHPLEAFLETIWLLPVLMVIPVHKYSLIIFAFISFLNNVKGHLGFEFSKGKATFLNSSTHHSMHHRYFKSNYGLYFLFWDRLCKTEGSTK